MFSFSILKDYEYVTFQNDCRTVTNCKLCVVEKDLNSSGNFFVFWVSLSRV